MARHRPRHRARHPRLLSSVAAAVVVVALLAAVALGVWKVWRAVSPSARPAPEGCQVSASGQDYRLDLEQSSNAAIIVAESLRRGLPARAASIALATAMQESRLRNIDYGDRDSLGLFQQRPSQGWGTQAQVMDPWYSSGRFYEELVKFGNWKTLPINDAAQQVQRSGVPDGYAKHEAAARAWASALTGHSPGALSCVNRSTETASAATLAGTARKGLDGRAEVTVSGTTVSVTGKDATLVRAGVALLMASTTLAPISAATAPDGHWAADQDHYAAWSPSAGPSASPAPSGSPARGSVTLR